MMILEILPIDKRKSKVLIDQGFAFVLYQGEIKRYHLIAGEELSEEIYQIILNQVLYKRAKEKVIYLLKMSDKTQKQLERSLKEGGFPKEAIQHAMDYARKKGFVNDERLAARYAEVHSGRESRRQIEAKLRHKGVEKETVDEVLRNQNIDEEMQVRQYLKKRGFVDRELTKEEKRKVMGALGRKGYSFTTISRVLGEIYDEFC